MNAQPKNHGRPPIDLDMARVRELLASMPLVKVAETLGVHRNTLYRRVQRDPLWRECVELPRKRRRRTPSIPYQPDPFQAFIAQHLRRECTACHFFKPLAEFPFRTAQGTYRNRCRDCTRWRWNELQALKRKPHRLRRYDAFNKALSLDATLSSGEGNLLVFIADSNADDPLEKLCEQEAVESIISRLISEKGMTAEVATALVEHFR